MLPTVNLTKLILLVFLILIVSFVVIKLADQNLLFRSGGSSELSKEDYQTVKEELLKIVEIENPRAALGEIKSRIKNDNALLSSCHSLAHEIGHYAYNKYKDFYEAVKYQDEICNSGYVHGLMENHFSNRKDVISELKKVCEPYSTGTLVSGQCYHGIGHGMMYFTSNDLPKSLSMCEYLDSRSARLHCADGVFMENFNTDNKIHPSKFIDNHNLFQPCIKYGGEYKGNCYRYAAIHYLSIHKQDYNGALKWCETADPLYIRQCTGGVGAETIKENLEDPKFAEKVCMSNEAAQVASCIGEMARYYILNFASKDPARHFCANLEQSNKQSCNFFVNQAQDFGQNP